MKSLTPSFECEVAEGVAERTLKNAIYVGPPVARCVKGGPWKIQCLYAFNCICVHDYMRVYDRMHVYVVLRGHECFILYMDIAFVCVCMCGRVWSTFFLYSYHGEFC